MWDLFNRKPACPVDAKFQQWIDGRFGWLEEQLGRETPRKVRVILPTPEFFPDRFDGREEDAQTMLNRVAEHMNVDPKRFKLQFYTSARHEEGSELPIREEGSSAAGYYRRDAGLDQLGRSVAAIGINVLQLADPMCLVATLAHEVGHEILLGQGRITSDEQDHEPLTDLLTVFLGMGIFTANSTIRDRGWTAGNSAGWKVQRLGYLDQRNFGYALARFAQSRGEARPAWMKHVRADVRLPLKKGLKYLAERRS